MCVCVFVSVWKTQRHSHKHTDSYIQCGMAVLEGSVRVAHALVQDMEATGKRSWWELWCSRACKGSRLSGFLVSGFRDRSFDCPEHA